MYVTDTFWITLVRAMGGTNHTNSLPLLRRWQVYEGGTAEWNPLNDTDEWNGSTPYNSAGVQNYRSEVDGVNATAHTLQNGKYPAICAALKNDSPASVWSQVPIPAEIDKWGTHGFAAYLRTLSPTPIPPPIPTHLGELPMYLLQGPDNQGTWFLYEDGTMIGTNEQATIDSALAAGIKLITVAHGDEAWAQMRAKSARVNPPTVIIPPTS